MGGDTVSAAFPSPPTWVDYQFMAELYLGFKKKQNLFKDSTK